MSTILSKWYNLCLQGFKESKSKYSLSMVCLEGVYPNVDWEYTDLGFTPKRWNKLYNRYIIPGSIDKFNEKLSNIKDGAALLRLGHKEKVGGNRDWCLTGIVVPKIKNRVSGIDIHIRSSEVVSQFLVDLKFLDELMIRECSIALAGKYTRITIGYAFVSKIFYPVFYKMAKLKYGIDTNKHIKHGKKYIEDIDSGKLPTWRLAARAANAYLQLKDKDYEHNICRILL